MDSINETIMAIDMRDYGTIGCAYYVARDEKLYLMEDVKLGNVDLADTLKLHATPTIILINTKSDEKLEERLAPDARRIDRAEDESMLFLSSLVPTANITDTVNGLYILETRPAVEFKYEAAKDRLISLNLKGDGGNNMAFLTPDDDLAMHSAFGEDVTSGRQGQLMRLAGHVDLDSFISVRDWSNMLTWY